MRRLQKILALGVCSLLVSVPVGWAAEKPPEILEQEYQREDNPRKQADIARRLITQRLELLRSRIGTGMMLEETSPELADYGSAVEMLERAVRQASHNGTSKKAEKDLRDQSNELEDLKILVSAAERPLIDHLLTQVSELLDELIYGLMLPPPEEPEEGETARQ